MKSKKIDKTNGMTSINLFVVVAFSFNLPKCDVWLVSFHVNEQEANARAEAAQTVADRLFREYYATPMPVLDEIDGVNEKDLGDSSRWENPHDFQFSLNNKGARYIVGRILLFKARPKSRTGEKICGQAARPVGRSKVIYLADRRSSK